MNIQITADSTIDLNADLLKKYNIKTIGLNISLDDKDYIDGETIVTSQILEFIKQKNILPKTGAVSVERYKEFFKKYSKNDTTIIHFTISSELSSSFYFAETASKEFKNVFVVDSRFLSTGIAVNAIWATQLASQGCNAEEIVNTIQDACNQNKVQCSFILDNLKLLHKGGRCSAVQKIGANLLRLKICIGVKDGKMGVDKKYKGKFEKVISEYIEDTLKSKPNYDSHCCFITYTTASQELLDNAKQAVEKYGNFENIYFTTAGATIASHCGENTIGILYRLK